MGSPKPLLKIGESTFLGRILDCYTSLGIPSLVVLGKDSTEIQSTIDLASATVLVNPDPSRGPLSSLLIALEKTSRSDAVFLHPVDHPLVLKETVKILLRCHRKIPHCILIPEYLGRRGHPVVFPSKFYADLRAAPLTEGARWAVRANRGANHLVAVDDPAVLFNIDTRKDYKELAEYPSTGQKF